MDLVKFDPSIEELNKIVAHTSSITVTDLSDDTQLALVHDTRISLRDARVRIEKTGKEYRAEALAHQKAVIAREKELISIIEPEEIRLKGLEEQANTIKGRAARAALLPMRKEQLVKTYCVCPDEQILDMDNDQFIQYLNQCVSDKNEQDRLAIEAEKAELADDARIAQVKKDAEVAERNRIEGKAKVEEADRIEKAAQAKRDAEKEAAKIIQDAKDKVAQEAAQAEAALREAQVREQQAKDEALRKEAKDKFIAWEETMGVTPETAAQYKTVHAVGGIELWKLVGTYTE